MCYTVRETTLPEDSPEGEEDIFMADPIKRAMLLIWRMVYPLLIYQVLAELVTGGYQQVVSRQPADGVWAVGPAEAMILPLTGAGALLAAIPLGHLYMQERYERQLGSERRGGQRCFPQMRDMLIWSGVAGVCASLCFNNLLRLFPMFSEKTEQVAELIYSPSFGMQLLCTVFIIPLTEELIFRGLGYRRIRRELPFVWAALASAVFFGLYHGNLYQGIYACFLGMLLAFLYEKSDSFLAVWGFHGMANLTSITMNAMAWDEGIFEYTAIKVVIFTATGLLLIYLLNKVREDGRKREITINSDSLL